MKKCSRCDKERYSIFSRYCREHYQEADRKRYYKNREKRLLKDKKRYIKNREKRKEQNKIFRMLPKEAIKEKARQTLRNAVAAGKIKRLPCEKCGKVKTHAHHTDYSKPLKVHWLCVDHHYEQHRKYLIGK